MESRLLGSGQSVCSAGLCFIGNDFNFGTKRLQCRLLIVGEVYTRKDKRLKVGNAGNTLKGVKRQPGCVQGDLFNAG